jgi:YidC/Oxa1 family membrane protein insertase
MDEIRASEALYGAKKKNLVAVGYNLIDDLIEQYNNLTQVANDKKVILIAPSWQKDNMLELCIDDVLENLLDCGYKLIVRPHPEFSKRYPNKLKEIMERYAEKISEDFIFETDFSSSSSIFTSDMLITDWSAIAIEFSYTTLKPSLFINTPPKVMNPNYKKIPIVPLDIALRDLLGVSVDVDKLSLINDTVADMFNRQDDFKKQILETREKFLFNLGNSGEVGGRYIIDRLR